MLQHGLLNAVGCLRASCRRLLLMSCAEAAAAREATVARRQGAVLLSATAKIPSQKLATLGATLAPAACGPCGCPPARPPSPLGHSGLV